MVATLMLIAHRSHLPPRDLVFTTKKSDWAAAVDDGAHDGGNRANTERQLTLLLA
jgi:hypothetical protein